MTIDYQETGEIDLALLKDTLVVDIEGKEVGHLVDIELDYDQGLRLRSILIKPNFTAPLDRDNQLLAIKQDTIFQLSPIKISLDQTRDSLRENYYRDQDKQRILFDELLQMEVVSRDGQVIGSVIGVHLDRDEPKIRVSGDLFEQFLERFSVQFEAEFVFGGEFIADIDLVGKQLLLAHEEDRVRSNLVLHSDQYQERIRRFQSLDQLKAPLHLNYQDTTK